MDIVTLNIDNKHVSVAVGTTVLAAAISTGIYIPTLCSHPDLPPTSLEMPATYVFQGDTRIENQQPDKGATKCGMCIVEIRGEKDLLSSCTVQAKENMVVVTDNERIREQRKNNLIPILSRHKHACLTCAQQEGCSQTQCSSNVPEIERCCSQFGNCELRNVVDFVGISDSTSKWIPTTLPIEENEPLFKTDYNLCIGCIRCIRACNRVRGVGAIGFVWDNQDTLQVGTTARTLADSECKFCTACVEICPTGALKDKFVRTGNKEEDIVPCKAACPVHIDIPEYLRMISLGKFDAANAIIREKIPFPAVLGRICMHPCEYVCRRGKINSAVSICSLKRFVSDVTEDIAFYKTILNNKNQETGKNVAIIGSGPTGLAASFYLRKKGHNVVIYDERDKAGGMLRYGIPSYRLPTEILDNEIKSLLSIGVELRTNTKLGTDFDLDYLRNTGANAILIATGAQNDRKIPLEGSDLNGVLGGMNFLRKVAKEHSTSVGRNVTVIGGGNVAIDVAMTAMRCGAEQVSIVCLESEHEMPANVWEIETMKSENIKVLPSWSPKKIIGKNGCVIKLEVVKCMSVFDENGTFNPQCDYKTKEIIKTDQVLMAVGQESDLSFLDATDVSTNNGFIIVNEDTLETTSPGIYSGGDAVSMPGSVISAVAAGRKVATTIDVALGGTGIIDEVLFERLPPNGYLGRNDGFSRQTRENNRETNPQNRHGGFEEIVLGFSKEQAIQEAARCLQCDLRLNFSNNPHPPEKLWPLTIECINTVIPNETEGVYKLFDKNKTVISIVGTSTLLNDLISAIEKDTAKFFEFEKEKMYSKRESELIQKHLQEHGEMPGSNDEMDDLF